MLRGHTFLLGVSTEDAPPLSRSRRSQLPQSAGCSISEPLRASTEPEKTKTKTSRAWNKGRSFTLALHSHTNVVVTFKLMKGARGGRRLGKPDAHKNYCSPAGLQLHKVVGKQRQLLPGRGPRAVRPPPPESTNKRNTPKQNDSGRTRGGLCAARGGACPALTHSRVQSR